MTLSRYAILLGLGAALTLTGAARAQTTALTGMWLLSPEDFAGDQELKMPLTPAAQAVRAAQRKAIESGNVVSDNAKRCLPEGMPSMMTNEFAVEFLETPQRVTIINEASSLVRSVYLDETVHTKSIERSWNGHSIGHWEGDTLVIDTVNFNDKASLFGFVGLHSSTTHLVERYHVENGGKTLVGELTFEDPRYLTAPWTHVVHYNRLPPHSELWEYACEPEEGWVARFKGDPQAKAAGTTPGS